MSVISEPARGSRFSFTASFGRVPDTRDSLIRARLSLAGCRVLIADDCRTSRLAIREMLDDTGADLDEASNGNIAYGLILQAAKEGRPYHFVILDMAMPILDGFEVARRLHNYDFPLKSLLPMLLSDELKPQIARLQQLGIETYLVKPVSRKHLLRSIQLLVDEARSAGLAAPAQYAERHHTTSKSILVAEDSPDNRLVIAAYLRHEPYQIDFAADGRQALEKFIANLYDLVLMDIQMPEMDGLETTRAIRQWESEHGRVPTPIVALTAYALEEDIRRALSAGCSLHISKPIVKQALIDCLHEAMRLSATSDSDRHAPRSRYYS